LKNLVIKEFILRTDKPLIIVEVKSSNQLELTKPIPQVRQPPPHTALRFAK
jgi:hypothetical protein